MSAPLLVTKINHICIAVGAKVSNCICIKQRGVMIHLCLIVNGCFFKSSLTLENRLIIPNQRKLWSNYLTIMMTSWNGNIFRVTGPFSRGIHRSPVDSPHKGQWRTLIISLICVWTNGWATNCDAGDLRRHRVHYDVIVMVLWFQARKLLTLCGKMLIR